MEGNLEHLGRVKHWTHGILRGYSPYQLVQGFCPTVFQIFLDVNHNQYRSSGFKHILLDSPICLGEEFPFHDHHGDCRFSRWHCYCGALPRNFAKQTVVDGDFQGNIRLILSTCRNVLSWTTWHTSWISRWISGLSWNSCSILGSANPEEASNQDNVWYFFLGESRFVACF